MKNAKNSKSFTIVKVLFLQTAQQNKRVLEKVRKTKNGINKTKPPGFPLHKYPMNASFHLSATAKINSIFTLIYSYKYDTLKKQHPFNKRGSVTVALL